MKYWFYSEGNILGPYEPAEMLALPAFADESLVCPETATGDNPGDWRPASQMGEIAAAMSFGAGRTITAGVVAGAYEYETGFNSTVNYFDNKEPLPGASYGELLDTIDNILGAYKESPAAPGRPPETDYDLAEKFDVRLSHIQEELEAARWEKNLLLEKMRIKEHDDIKQRERIVELEGRLKSALGHEGAKDKELEAARWEKNLLLEKIDMREREDRKQRELIFEQLHHLTGLKAKTEAVRQVEEAKREELESKKDISTVQRPGPDVELTPPAAAPVNEFQTLEPQPVSEIRAPEEKPGPKVEARPFKSISRCSEIKPEISLGKDLREAGDDAGFISRKLKRLGQTQEPAYTYSGSHYDKPLPGPEAAPPGAFKPQEAIDPIPQQAGGIVYDFTVATPKPDTQQFQIEIRYKPPPPPPQGGPAQPQAVKPPTYDFGIAQQAPAPVPAPAPQPAPVQPQPPPAPQAKAAEAQTVSPAAQLSPAAVLTTQEKAPAGAPDSPEKTIRVPVPNSRGKAEVKAPEKPKKKGGRGAFLVILVVFGSMAAGGLGYFFMGEGVSFSEFSMLSLGGRKKSASMDSQLEAKPGSLPAAEPAPAPKAQQQARQPQPAPVEKSSNENIKKALDIVKGYKLSGGRGNIATWFANSFLSSASGGANEEWTATPLHGDMLVVQYRLLRPRQEPLIYQFEVDAAKSDIVRGINNNAIELLDLGAKEKAAVPASKPGGSASGRKKPAAKPKARKSSRPGEIPILPLPEAPPAGRQDQDPTGFETVQAESSEQVKYLKAQESDEELF